MIAPQKLVADQRAEGRQRTRRVVQFIPSGLDKQVTVHNADVSTLLHGVTERVFFHKTEDGFEPPHVPDYPLVCSMLRQARSDILRHTVHCTLLTRSQFLNCYKGPKRKRYEAAVESLERRGLERKDSYLSTFVKAEKLLKLNAVPRVIQPRNARYNVELGRRIKVAEKILIKAINKSQGYSVVMKGLNAVRRGEVIRGIWDSFVDPIAIGADASRFDQHVSKPCLRFEHTFYHALFPHDPELVEMLKWQLSNRGFGRCWDGNVMYQVEGSRMSGDMNTSLGNVVLMCSMMFSYFTLKGVGAKLINDGDDCVIFCERSDEGLVRDGFDQFFKELGFLMEVEPTVDRFEDVVFCQSQPVHDGSGWRMVRDPWSSLSKDSVTIKPVFDRLAYDRLRDSIGECGLALAGDLPILGEYYSCLRRGADTGRKLVRMPETGMDYLAIGLEPKFSPPTWESRVSFYRAFGILPTVQVGFEDFYRGITPAYHTPSLVDTFMLQDMGDRQSSI